MSRKLVGALLLCLAACAPTSTPPTVIPAKHADFDGIGALAQNAKPDQPLHILIIHGMGTTDANFFNGFMAQTAARLGLVQIGYTGAAPAPGTVVLPSGIPIPVPPTLPPEAQPALLYDVKFAPKPTDQQPTVIFTYLLWAPLTAGIKDVRLSEGDDPPSPDHHPPRQAFSNYAKGFIQQDLGDVVLYGGTYGANVIRPAVEAALCYFVTGTVSTDPRICDTGKEVTTVVVTHSLGGYILMDAIDDEISKEEAANMAARRQPVYRSPAAKIVRNTRYIYMLANQLPLLDLLQYNPAPKTTIAPDCTLPPREQQPEKHHFRMLDKFSCDWEKVKGRAASRLRLVAFSDPNDILSYLIGREDIGVPAGAPDAQHRSYTNIYVENGEFDIPNLYSDVFGAHLNYVSNPTVLDLFVCGMKDGAVKQPCPPPH